MSTSGKELVMNKLKEMKAASKKKAVATLIGASDIGGEGIVKKFSLAEMEEIATTYELNPVMVELKEPGDGVEGRLIGKGSPVVLSDEKKKRNPLDGKILDEHESLGTWVFETVETGTKFCILDAYQLANDLPPLIGHEVVVIKGHKKKNGMKEVNRFIVGKKRADGGMDIVNSEKDIIEIQVDG